ncbi:hypothetical protein MMC07_006673 [Pseudocyphellaria aurata]|nr:hypothetical protein [Pseudocyphellaria aurata]
MPTLFPRSSYYEKDYRQAAALIRARKPYLIPNIIAGISIFAMTIGIYTYTIHAISQDDFSDVPMPDAPSQPAHTPHVGVVKAVSPDALPRQK